MNQARDSGTVMQETNTVNLNPLHKLVNDSPGDVSMDVGSNPTRSTVRDFVLRLDI
jgi:hypothetical protein